MEQTVLKQLSALPNMNIKELESVWDNIFDRAPPDHKNPTVMRRKIAWRIQEMEYGGLSKEIKTKLEKLKKNPRYGSKRKKSMPAIGTQLVRYWGDEEHRVMVLADGFEYKSGKYKSLTPIATHITGTKRSGPKFFGLKQ